MSEKEHPQKLKNIVVMAHPRLADAPIEAQEIAAFLTNLGFQVTQGMLEDEGLREQVSAGNFDLLIALGGDGTMLRAGHLCAPVGIPILGINLGRFGFLTEVKQSQWREVLPLLLEDGFWLEKRMTLCAEHRRDEEVLGRWEVLNEAVVGRGQVVRPVRLITHIDGRFLTTFVADGLITATATGSTAYSLAVGGPILPPELRNILITPIAPHLSFDRSIVLAEGSYVSINVQSEHQAVLSIDGQLPIELKSGDRVEVRAGNNSVKFLRFQDPGYFYRNLTPHMNQNPITGNSR